MWGPLKHGHEARPASAGYNLAKTYGQTFVFWSFFLIVLPAGFYWLEERLGWASWRFASVSGRWCGVALFALGGSLGLTSAFVMAVLGRGTPLPSDCTRELVVAGPYRHVRNPMAIAGLVQGAAVGLFLGSPLVIAYALAGGPIWDAFVRPWEEADLEARFGDPYNCYRASVTCWLPRWRPYRPRSDPTV